MTDRWLAAFLADSPSPQDKNDKIIQNLVLSHSVTSPATTSHVFEAAEVARIRRLAANANTPEARMDPGELTIRGEALP